MSKTASATTCILQVAAAYAPFHLNGGYRCDSMESSELVGSDLAEADVLDEPFLLQAAGVKSS